MAERMVEPIEKTGVRSTQAKRRRQWEREKAEGYAAVDKRSGGVCEVSGCRRAAENHHHMAGRVGPGVNDPELLKHLCPPCDLRVTTEPEWAKANGLSLDRVPRGTSKDVAS